jgi:phenylacetic acid degradation operon negative regulatory protein
MSTSRDSLTARSVIASNLLGAEPPRLPAAALVAAGELFGLSSGATRTALSRMTAKGEVEAVDGWYELRGALAERRNRQADARAGAAGRWDGTWEVAVVVADRRPAADRAAVRTAMARLKLAEVREGLWTRPTNLLPDRSPTERAIVDDQCTWLRSVNPDDESLLLGAFDLDGWAATGHALVAELDAGLPQLVEATDLAPGDLRDKFLVAAASLRHLVDDPQLPDGLAPAGWPSLRLRAAYDDFDRALKARIRTWNRARR